MRTKVLSVKVCVGAFLFAGLFYNQIAISAEQGIVDQMVNATREVASSVSKEVKEVAGEFTASKPFISNGETLRVDDLGIAITPPQGWEVQEKAMNMTLIMQEPVSEAQKATNDLTFERNITVITMHGAAPIDEKQAAVVKEKLVKDFGGAAGVTNFKVLDEHKFFDYKDKSDGLVIYSTFTMNDVPMAQMHVMVSGAETHFLLTYTDLASQFEQNSEAFQKAWTTMSTMEVTGVPPARYQDLKIFGGIGAGCLFLFGYLLFMRSRRALAAYAEEDFDDMDDMSFNGGKSAVWSINPRTSRAAPLSQYAESSFHAFDDESVDFSDVNSLSSVSNLR